METDMHTHETTDVFGLLAVSRGLFRLLPPEMPLVEADPPASPVRRRRWLEGIDRWFSRARQRDVESYLAQSRDVFELERRIRDLERAKPSWPH